MRTSIESVVRGKIPEVRRHVVELLEFVDAGVMAAYAPLAPSFTDWKNNRNNEKSWKVFFQDNPSTFTFGDLPEDVH